MSGADRTSEQIANEVFWKLYPECPAFPGQPNGCDTQLCDCFNCDQLPDKVAALLERAGLPYFDAIYGAPHTPHGERATGEGR